MATLIPFPLRRSTPGASSAGARSPLAPEAGRQHFSRPLTVEDMARATRDYGMQDAIRERLSGKPRHVSQWSLFKADCADMVSEVRASPYSHATVAVLTVVAWTLLLIAPLLIGGGR